ncbi:HPP family protein [Gellertiella hungarica]|uniref:CBS domain-containing membrane protein n=1 Tax=Gellertiella hungarica TaxID=1572859 RepID=A0A7W6NJ17_9HYPH|nr:HPP family protein [Gellertiella hungarica]MBB4062950.1 CBS domain-containing membrane protein [Gellertiella hungarica]
METIHLFLARLVPALPRISPREIVRIGIGALIGIALTGYLTSIMVPGSALPYLIPPLGASAVLLFGVPASPLAQPWSILGGNGVSALVGVTVAMLVPDVFLASALAVSLAIVAMILCRCLHPPGGAVALTAVLGAPAIHSAGYHFVLMPAALNSLLLLVVALLYNNLTGHRYPHALPAKPQPVPHATQDPPPTQRAGLLRPDLEAALAQYDEILDIAPEDLEAILQQLQLKTFERRSGGIRVEHIMSRDVVAVAPGTTLEAAMAAMTRHDIRDLPVTEPTGHLRGIFTQSDLMRALALHGRNELTHPVGDYMTAKVETAKAEQPIALLVPAMADRGLHAMPVVDAEGRLTGMLTQSDLIAGLFARRSVIEVA